jgi:hypothetical protein
VNWLLKHRSYQDVLAEKKYLAPLLLVREMPNLHGGMSPDLDPTIKLDIPIFILNGIEPKLHVVRGNPVCSYYLVFRSLKK